MTIPAAAIFSSSSFEDAKRSALARMAAFAFGSDVEV